MKRIFAFLTAAMLISAAAHADTFVWQDPAWGFTMSFPDSWTVQTQDNDNTRLRIAGPIGEDFATCKMAVQKDGRIQIYPKSLTDKAVVEKLGLEYWKTQIGEHQSPQIVKYYAPAGLGSQGDATAVHVSFVRPDGAGHDVPMFGVMVASLYGDDLYVASCSSKYEMYERYATLFGSIIDSVEFKSKYHPFYTGYYRNFLMDPQFALPRVKPGTTNANLQSFDPFGLNN